MSKWYHMLPCLHLLTLFCKASPIYIWGPRRMVRVYLLLVCHTAGITLDDLRLKLLILPACFWFISMYCMYVLPALWARLFTGYIVNCDTGTLLYNRWWMVLYAASLLHAHPQWIWPIHFIPTRYIDFVVISFRLRYWHNKYMKYNLTIFSTWPYHNYNHHYSWQ